MGKKVAKTGRTDVKQVFRLHEVPPVSFDVELHPGVVESYDPFEVARHLEPLTVNPEQSSIAGQLHLIREAFRFCLCEGSQPVGTECTECKKWRVSDGQCWLLVGGLMEFLQTLAAAKKAEAVLPS